MQYFSTLKAKLIYVFSIDDSAHRGCVKIGEATLDEATNLSLAPNCSELNAAARKRIDQYTKTAGIQYTLHYTELTVSIRGGLIQAFNDKAVHEVLIRSGIARHDFSQRNQGREWFECSVETAVKAIQAVKEGRTAIDSHEIVPIEEDIVFRPEQREAIDKTVRKFTGGGNVMLWNAKMRFGKTLSALQVVKECGYHRTIIITHRPVVDKGWFDDFGKIFKDKDGYRYGSREKGFKYEELELEASMDRSSHYVYFASMQDLRGAQLAGGKFDKNAGIFAADYDMLIVDEAHEGTQTELGQNVIKLLTKKNTHVLNLSGTPFNLLEDYKEDEIYTWDYVMEQRAKEEWDVNHFGDRNPYAGLPKLNIFTFDLAREMSGFSDTEDKAFNFKEFFRTWTGDEKRDFKPMPEGIEGRFVHEKYVRNFLDLIVRYDPETNYPFSTKEFRNSFRHTLWMVPGVKEARALSALLKQHTIFGQFEIVNVAGDGDEEVENDNALSLVENAMGKNPEETRTITLSCGKLTTGVSVKPWTAVMMLSGSHSTDAKAYMQTIFRVQTPYTTDNGRRKENCYVFDFAPDRTLKVLADTVRVSQKNTTRDSEKGRLGEFLNFCPVIGFNGTRMAEYDAESMLEQLKRAYISRVTKNGCDDPRLYNQEMLRKLDREALAKFQKLHKIIGSTKANHQASDVDVNKTGLTDEQYRELEKIGQKRKSELTEEDRRLLEEAREKKKNADSAISILRGISIRLPLLMYGAELNGDELEVTLENFTDLIDDQSWEEFMPRGVTKDLFREFIPYYDPDVFRAVGKNYRDLVRAADQLTPARRVQEIARIFTWFRNPDKETVLTPWRVVNMHMGDCIGGWKFYDDDNETESLEPHFVDRGEVTEAVLRAPDTRILEINSKTGLYPLYMAYSVFALKLQRYRDTHNLPTDVPVDTQNEIWDEVLRDNIFVVCKTEMARSITKRTLRGFRDAKVNARYFEDLVNKITNQSAMFLGKMRDGRNYWKNNNIEENMKFNAIVGNPPYQVSVAQDNSMANAIYPEFISIAQKLMPDYISMITPSRWMTRSGRGINDEWVTRQLTGNHFITLFDYPNASDCFPNVEIKGGVSYWLFNSNYIGKCRYILHNNGQTDEIDNYLDALGAGIVIRDVKAIDIIKRISAIEGNYYNGINFSCLVGPMNPYTDCAKGILGSSWRGYNDSKDSEYCIKIYLNKKLDPRGYGWIKKSDIPKFSEGISMNKVYLPEGGGSGNDSIVLGTPFVGEPGSVCSQTYIQIAYNPDKHRFTENECENIVSYIKTRFFRYLVSIKKRTQHTSKDVFQFVPIQDWSKPWTDDELYKKYNLSREEICYIESRIKPMGEPTLFDADSLVDPEFANFNLSECGVNAGDTITYTPTKAELTVLEDNRVEYGGESMSLAVFTANNMPRNKRSKSGVCQGPKYFTYNGTSLYELRRMFSKDDEK